MKIRSVLFVLLTTLSAISNCMAEPDFATQRVSFNKIYKVARNKKYKSIYNSDFIFMLYPYSTNDKWVINEIAQACVNYTTVDTNVTIDMCQNFIKDIIGVKQELPKTIEVAKQTEKPKPKVIEKPKASNISITTTPNTTEFTFNIYATGKYTVLCGDNKAATVNTADGTYTCKYDRPGIYTVTISGTTTAYSSNAEKPAISFMGNKNVASVNGSFGGIFPVLSNGSVPIFYQTFSSCTNLTSISADLFSGINTAPVKNMFNSTFERCTSLASIPAGLFSSIQGAPAENMFDHTFWACKSLTTIPSDLFAGIQGSPAAYMFYCTFLYCTGLRAIPDNLFKGIQGAPAESMFESTFDWCRSLTSIPAGLFSGIKGAPAKGMFYSTFEGCDALTSLPPDLFSGIEGPAAEDMYAATFFLCTELKDKIKPTFFGNITPKIDAMYLMDSWTILYTDITLQ